MDRRAFLLQGATIPLTQQRKTVIAYVGCYTTAARKGRGDGIHAYHVHPATGAWNQFQKVGDLVNPSFLITNREGNRLYSVHGDESYATAFSIRAGLLTKLNEAKTGGKNGVHQAIDATGRYMVVANYGSATVAVLPIRPDGSLADYTQLVELKGPLGPHRVEQSASHPHQVVFDPSGRFVIVPDKGLDRTFVFRFQDGKLSEHATVDARPGDGPRHMAFHPDRRHAYILNELSSTVVTCEWDGATLKPVQVLSTLPDDFLGKNTGAEILVTNRFVYCSNRGHDSVTVFSIDAATGRLSHSSWTASQGSTPRFMTFDPDGVALYVANEQGDTIVSFHADPTTGKLQATGQVVRTGTPVTIAFAKQ